MSLDTFLGNELMTLKSTISKNLNRDILDNFECDMANIVRLSILESILNRTQITPSL